jgi:hypothetical protein
MSLSLESVSQSSAEQNDFFIEANSCRRKAKLPDLRSGSRVVHQQCVLRSVKAAQAGRVRDAARIVAWGLDVRRLVRVAPAGSARGRIGAVGKDKARGNRIELARGKLALREVIVGSKCHLHFSC